MKRENRNHEKDKDLEKQNHSQEEVTGSTNDMLTKDSDDINVEEKGLKELEEIKIKLEEKTKLCEEHFDKFQRTVAEFDNYKKRTLKEKESLCTDVTVDVVAAILPVVDSLERAVQAAKKEDNTQSLREGIELVFKQMKEVMKGLGVQEILCKGENFNPELHNAVMHIEDEAYGENEVIEEFQKGYILKDKVVRHSMVKVAN